MAELSPLKLRIALVAPFPPPAGGMANQARQLVELLGQEGVTVESVRVNAPYKPSWVGRVKGLRALFRLLPYLWLLWKAAGRAQLFHVMANSGWSWHLFATPAIWIARLRKTPVVLNYRGGEAESFFSRSMRWIRPSLKRVDTIVVPSGFLQDVFRRWGFDSTIVPNIIDLSRFSTPQEREDREAKGPNILVARNLEPIYDNATALHAFREVVTRIPGATLTIAGCGPERDTLGRLAQSLGIADVVTFTGRVDNENMPALYRASDVLLNPSLADNMPISILEALASGVPVVSTNVGGVPYLVKDGETAFLVPPQDPRAMAARLIELLADRERMAQMRAAGLSQIKAYAWPNVREQLFAAYDAALHGARSTPVAEPR